MDEITFKLKKQLLTLCIENVSHFEQLLNNCDNDIERFYLKQIILCEYRKINILKYGGI